MVDDVGLTMSNTTPTESDSDSSHLQRIKCIYLDDLVAAVHECHESFLLVKKNLSSINRQLTLRRCPPKADQLIRTEQGLVQEYAHHLQEAMKDVLDAVEEHFYAEIHETGKEKPPNDALWTATDELMSRPGSTGSTLLSHLAALVVQERKMLQNLERTYSLESELAKFQVSENLDALVEAEQCSHVRSFLRTRQHENECVRLEDKLASLRNEYMELLNQTARRDGVASEERLRDLKEDWSHGLDERLELVAIEAEAKCLEEIRGKLQEEMQSHQANQDAASVSRSKIEQLRQEVRRNQDTIRTLTRRNADGRRQLSETRADVQRLADNVSSQLTALRSDLTTATDSAQRCIAKTERCESPEPLPPPPPTCLAADAVIARLARQVVSESEQSCLGSVDFERLLEALRNRTEGLGVLRAADERESSSSAEHKRPLVEIARAARERGDRRAQEVERMVREKEELPRALQLPRK